MSEACLRIAPVEFAPTSEPEPSHQGSQMPPRAFAAPHPQQIRSRPRGRAAGLAALTALTAVIASVAFGATMRAQRDGVIEERSEARLAALPRVLVDEARRQPSSYKVELPGTIAPLETAQIFARATGYVARRAVDIGSKVKAGQVLAVIESRELESQVAQARQTLAQAVSNHELSKATAARSAQLVERGYTTRQKFDEDRLTETARAAEVDAAKAVLAQAEQRRSYLTVVAPFDGTVTQRSVETGDLVSADDAAGRPMFVVSRASSVRARVYASQETASNIRVGDQVEIRLPERQRQAVTGTVTRTAAALSTASRTMLVEVEVPNAEDLLTPGAYVRVEFALHQKQTGVTVGASSLIYNSEGLQVAVVRDDGKLDLRQVAIGRDYGTEVEVREGLTGGERVVRNPPSFLRAGQKVEVRTLEAAAK